MRKPTAGICVCRTGDVVAGTTIAYVDAFLNHSRLIFEIVLQTSKMPAKAPETYSSDQIGIHIYTREITIAWPLLYW